MQLVLCGLLSDLRLSASVAPVVVIIGDGTATITVLPAIVAQSPLNDGVLPVLDVHGAWTLMARRTDASRDACRSHC